MSKRPVLPLWVADFLGDTQGLSQGEIAAYLLLLMGAWVGDGSLSDNNAELRRIARSSERWWPQQRPRVLERFFVKGEDGRWRQKRLTEEIAKVTEYSESRRQNAKGRPAEPVDNPVDNLWTETEVSSVRSSMYQKNKKANEINGHSEHMLRTLNPRRNSELTFCNPPGRASENSRQQKQELKINFRKDAEAARQRQASNAARAAWEADLAKNLAPDEFAELIEWVIANPAVADRATLRQQQEPGAGAQAVAAAFLKAKNHGRARKI